MNKKAPRASMRWGKLHPIDSFIECKEQFLYKEIL